MKRIDASIEVKTQGESPVPKLFRWQGQTYDVRRVLEVWRKETKWWQPSGPERRDYYRCVVKTGSSSRGGHAVVEIYRRTLNSIDEWKLARLVD